ncbi:MAG: GntR family transcriptional regulator [Chloroflexota bacterium]
MARLVDYAPRYRQIEQTLRTKVASLRPGDPLPSDAALSAEFGVSRMTARNAMQQLVEEGLAVRIPGRGTFVAEPPAHRQAHRLMSFTAEMERQGRAPTSRLLAREIRTARPREAEALALAIGEPIVFLRRLRLADNEPIAIETAVLNIRCGPAVMAADLEHGSLHEALARAGIVLRRGTATIEAEGATRSDARLLGVRVGSPLLVERRVIVDVHGKRVEATESRYPADRYALDVSFDVEAPGGGRG